MREKKAKLHFEIRSKAGINTPSEIQHQFFSDQKFYENDLNVYSISCMSDKKEVPEGTQSIDTIDVIIGLMGNIVGSFLYDFLKKYLVGKNEVKKKNKYLIVETSNYTIILFSDELNTDEIITLIEKLIKNSKS